MLESIKKANDRGAFTVENECPVNMETIEVYLQILRPAYQFMFMKKIQKLPNTKYWHI